MAIIPSVRKNKEYDDIYKLVWKQRAMTKLILASVFLGFILTNNVKVLGWESNGSNVHAEHFADLVAASDQGSRPPESEFKKLERNLNTFKDQAKCYSSHILKIPVGDNDRFLSETRIERMQLSKSANLIKSCLIKLNQYHLEGSDRNRIQDDLENLGNLRIFYERFADDSRASLPKSREKSVSSSTDLIDFLRGNASTFSGIDMPPH